jgi:hypothetical protein
LPETAEVAFSILFFSKDEEENKNKEDPFLARHRRSTRVRSGSAQQGAKTEVH